MSRGTKQLPQNGNSSAQSQSSPQSSVRRGNKTLGWYMSGLDALDGGKKEGKEEIFSEFL